MGKIPGVDKPDLKALPTIRERLSFLYVERCRISRLDGAISMTDARGTVCIPAASLSVLMLGPGTNVSHRAMELMGDVGATVIWVGEQGVRYYAHGRPLTHSSRLIVRQAELVSNTRLRLGVAREMYRMRFPGECVDHLTMQQLRGREGSRIRSVYRKASKETGVPWSGREYRPDDFDGGSAVNKSLSAAHACLYGAVHGVIVALGCSPALGFVHVGHERSFVYDIADLYKAELTIPIAFQVASEDVEDVAAETRRRVRDAFSTGHVMEQAARDIHTPLLGSEAEDELAVGTLRLWDEKGNDVAAGVQYSSEDEGWGAEALEEGYGVIIGDDGQ